MSKFSVKISDIQKEHKPKYYVSTWDMSSIRAKEKYRLYKNDVHNLRKFERSEQRLRTVELYSNNQNFGYGQKFLIDLLAMFNYAMMLWEGIGVDKDLKKAKYWMEQSADGGNLDAKYNVGVLNSILSEYKVSNDDGKSEANEKVYDDINNISNSNDKDDVNNRNIKGCTKRHLLLLLGQWKCYIPNQ